MRTFYEWRYSVQVAIRGLFSMRLDLNKEFMMGV
jgi:hypothetical protein